MHATNKQRDSTKFLANWMVRRKINPNLLSFNCFLRLIMIINNNYEKQFTQESRLDDATKVTIEGFSFKFMHFIFMLGIFTPNATANDDRIHEKL